MKGISETAFASQVEDLLLRFGWRWMHIKPAMPGKGAWLSRTNPEGKGFPDYMAVRPPRLLFAELKDQYSKTTPEQEAWLEDLRGRRRKVRLDTVVNSPEIYLWRPDDLPEIIDKLR